MTVQLLESPGHRQHLELEVNTFEELSTTRHGVGEFLGGEHPLTNKLKYDIQHSIDPDTHQFIPKHYEADEATTIIRALRHLSQDEKDKYNISAQEVLKQLPENTVRELGRKSLREVLRSFGTSLRHR
jgi:hypothetical protein